MTKPITRRRTALGLAALAPSALALSPAIVRARTLLPDKQLHLYVGFVANGGADTVARRIARVLERRTSRHITVDNRPGSQGATPGELVRRAAPDGTSIAFLASNSLASKLAMKEFPFDPLTDIAPIGLVGTFALGYAVSPKIGIDNFPDYVGWLKSGEPERRRLGNTSSDAFIDVLSHVFSRAFDGGLKVVSYRGASPMVNDLYDGRIPAAVTAVPSLLPSHRGGRLRLLMTTSPRRLRTASSIPTAREVGLPQLEMQEWYGLFASAATPPELIEAWNSELRYVLADPEVVSELTQLGVEVEPGTPEEAKARLVSHLTEWRLRMKEAGLAPVI